MADLKSLKNLNEQLKTASLHTKIEILSALPEVREFLHQMPMLRTFLAGLTPECESALLQLAVVGQAERLVVPLRESLLRPLLMQLIAIDQFYREMGGIIGYQVKILELLNRPEREVEASSYHSPSFQEFVEETDAVREAIQWGIEAMPEMAEFYPLGGAADRLHLVDPETGLELPAAKLPFAGRPLLDHLIRDLAAREYLYYKIFRKQLTTPIAIMTSHEKENHRHVLQILGEANWFGRPKESFQLFSQPLVPAVNSRGEWIKVGPLKPLLKPGGHGAIWKLAKDMGIFDWLEREKRKKALVRQINNPLAGLDYGLLAFTGYGWKKNMIFGFASCPRLLQAAEGVNVLIERKKGEGKELVLSNIEYCDFPKFGIEDLPLRENEPYSRFSSNTNILFADLKALSQAVESCPFPGLLINLKSASYTTDSGEKKEEPMARLESTMQNIADVFAEEKEKDAPLKTDRTFVTYNRRHKTISTAKKAYMAGKSLQETPENCFYDLLKAHRELLEDQCGFSLPSVRSLEEYLKKGPDFLFLYHPALGPLYSIIAQKLKRGKLTLGSEWVLEIAEPTIFNLSLDGSLRIFAEQPVGHFDERGILRYSDQIGECILENVTVQNKGIDWSSSSPFWKMELQRRESLTIHLKGKSLFKAHDVTFLGNQTIIVEDGVEMHAFQKGGKLILEEHPFKTL